jgi:hypothetical protein
VDRAAPPLFALAVATYLMTASGHLYLGDAWSVLRTAEAIVTRGALDIPFDEQHGGAFGPDGLFYCKYGPALVVHMLAPAAAGTLLERALCGPAATADERSLAMGLPASLANVPFCAAAVALTFEAARRIGYARVPALWASLALAFGTMLWPHAKLDAFESSLACALILCFCLLVGDRPRAAAAGLALGWAVLIKPAALVALPVLGAYAAHAARGGGGGGGVRGGAASALIRFVAGPAAAVALTLAYNAVRFASPLETGYSAEVQTTTIPFLMGLYGLLLSAGKGVFFYSPALLLALAGAARFARRHVAEAGAILGVAAVHLVLYASLQNWDGDWSWGPRYLLPCLPFLMLLALPVFDEPPAARAGRVALAAVCAAGVGVQILAVLPHPWDYIRWIASHKSTLGDFLGKPEKVYVPLHPHHFNPDFSPLRGQFHMLRVHLARAAGRPAPPMRIHSSIEETSDRSGHRLERVLELPPPDDVQGIDVWIATGPAIAARVPGTRARLAALLCWVLFAANAMAIVASRRALRRAFRAVGAGGGDGDGGAGHGPAGGAHANLPDGRSDVS